MTIEDLRAGLRILNRLWWDMYGAEYQFQKDTNAQLSPPAGFLPRASGSARGPFPAPVAPIDQETAPCS